MKRDGLSWIDTLGDLLGKYKELYHNYSFMRLKYYETLQNRISDFRCHSFQVLEVVAEKVKA
jgi:hypothetical protein